MKLLIYVVECAIIQGLFYMVFHLLLRKQTNFQINRIYLLSTLVASMIIPAVEIQLPSSVPLTMSIFQIKEVVIQSNIASPDFGFNHLNLIISAMAIASCCLYLIWFTRQLWHIRQLLTHSLIKKNNRIYIVETKHPLAFSFFNYIFINQNISSNERKKIILHEKTHIQQWHTLDRIFIDLILVSQWFNPFAWLFRKAIIENHEFLADAGTLRHGINQVNYQQLLLNQLFRTNQVQFVTYFNQSLIKKRIFMMTKITNKRTERIRFFLALPLAAIIVVCFSFKASLPEQVLDPITNNVMNKLSLNDLSSIIQKDTIKKSNLQKSKNRHVFIVAEQNATFQGGDLETFRAWILQNLKYPENAAKKGIQGKVILSFVIEADGKINEIKVLRSVDSALDEEAIRVIKSSPDWMPGRHGGKTIAQQFTIPIAFKVQK